MRTRIFISRVNEGWSEIEIPEKYHHIPYDKLVLISHIFLKEYTYKGLLITENPSSFPVRKKINHVSELS